MSTSKSSSNTFRFYISGLHCPSCEILIEKKLRKQKGVISANVSLKKNTLAVESIRGIKFSAQELNQMFLEDGYKFSLKPFSKKLQYDSNREYCSTENTPVRNPFFPFLVGLGFVLAFIFLNKTGFSSLISVNSQSSLPVFFLFGLLAGVSSCAALTGGIVLSLSKQWTAMYSTKDSTLKKLEPHFLFNTGRILSYALFGAVLGQIGNFFRLSLTGGALLVIAVSLIMVVLGLQLLGVKALSRFQLKMPKGITKKIADESNFSGKFGPILMGALTFFLPCGFTATAQALALASGNPIQGGLIMMLFALGTLPGLLAVGVCSVKFFSNQKLSHQFSTIAGSLVLFFALFNINSQLAVLGTPNLNDIFNSPQTSLSQSGELPPIIGGKQVVKMEAASFSYTPNRFKIRAGVPVRWEITDTGTSGCTNAVISRGLFQGQIDLVPGTTSVKEFTPSTPGTYKFSCWMGMVSGAFEVVDASGNAPTNSNTKIIDSGAKGCGCGGGSGTCGMIR